MQWLGDIRLWTNWYEELEALFFQVDDDAYGAPKGNDEVECPPGEHEGNDGVEVPFFFSR